MADIKEIEGIGAAYATKLETAGAGTTEKLLALGATPKGREALYEQTGISAQLLLEWVNHADLMRIKGVGSEYSDLLEAAGVDTVAELAQRNAANLAVALAAINDSKNITRRVPGETECADWIAQAKSLPRVVTY